MPFWERAQSGGRKSFRFEELDQTFILGKHQGVIIPYLEMINKDILERERDAAIHEHEQSEGT